MRLVGWIVVLCIGLAVLRAALAVGLVVGGVVMLIALIAAPRQTLGVLAALVLLGAFAAHPALGLTFLFLAQLLAGGTD